MGKKLKDKTAKEKEKEQLYQELLNKKTQCTV